MTIGMTIGEVAAKVGYSDISHSLLRTDGLLPIPHRISGKRRYEASVIQKLAVIQMAQQAGFSIAEIQTLLHDFPANTPPSVRWETLATTKLTEIDAMIERASQIKTFLEQALNCRCESLDNCAAITEKVSVRKN